MLCLIRLIMLGMVKTLHWFDECSKDTDTWRQLFYARGGFVFRGLSIIALFLFTSVFGSTLSRLDEDPIASLERAWRLIYVLDPNVNMMVSDMINIQQKQIMQPLSYRGGFGSILGKKLHAMLHYPDTGKRHNVGIFLTGVVDTAMVYENHHRIKRYVKGFQRLDLRPPRYGPIWRPLNLRRLTVIVDACLWYFVLCQSYYFIALWCPWMYYMFCWDRLDI